jgi:hypothetical protein
MARDILKAPTEGVPLAAYTPGPWTTDYRFGEASMVIVDDVGRLPIATTALYPLAQNNTQRVEANARLIAAAPDLLKQCQEARDFLSASHQNLTNGEWDDYGAMMLSAELGAAISKATGQ